MFVFKSNLRKHLVAVHSQQRKVFECDLCGGTLKTKWSVIGHLETHINQQCEFCGKTITKSRMANHINREHVEHAT